MTLMTDAPATAPEIEFVLPIMGLDQHTRFHLEALDEEGVLYSMRCVEQPSLRLFMVAPERFFPGYAPEIDDETVEALDLRDAREAAVLCVVNPGEDPKTATATCPTNPTFNIGSQDSDSVEVGIVVGTGRASPPRFRHLRRPSTRRPRAASETAARSPAG